jgi:pimeloyl-ACP methyl ester carboxylesterase
VSRIDEMLLAPADVVLARQIRRGTLASEPAAAVSPYATRTTVVHGGDDRAVPRALGEELAALGRHASFVPFEGAGHFVQLFHAARLAELAFRAG